MQVAMTVEDDHIIADFTGTEPQRRGSCNLTLVATVSAVYNAVLHMTDPDIPANAGRYRPIEVIAPAGTLVNATFPVATVGGNSETHPISSHSSGRRWRKRCLTVLPQPAPRPPCS